MRRWTIITLDLVSVVARFVLFLDLSMRLKYICSSTQIADSQLID